VKGEETQEGDGWWEDGWWSFHGVKRGGGGYGIRGLGGACCIFFDFDGFCGVGGVLALW